MDEALVIDWLKTVWAKRYDGLLRRSLKLVDNRMDLAIIPGG